MPTRSRSKAPSQRQLRVGELVRHALAEIFLRTELPDPELASAQFSVSEVRVSPDIRHAVVFIAPFTGKDGEEIVQALTRRQKFIRGELARQIELKYMPDIAFKLDRSFEESERIAGILRLPKVARDLG